MITTTAPTSQPALPPGPPSPWWGLPLLQAMSRDYLGFLRHLHDTYGDIVTKGAFANDLARWSGSAWAPFGGGATDLVFAETYYHGRLAIAGDFHQSTATGYAVHEIAGFDGDSFHDGNVCSSALVRLTPSKMPRWYLAMTAPSVSGRLM